MIVILNKKFVVLVFDCLYVVFYRCKILDRYLVILFKKYFEIKFLKLNVEKVFFFCERLRIKVIFILVLVKDGKI